MKFPIQAGLPDKATLGFIPEGKEGIIDTLKMMSGLVKKYKSALFIRQLAVEITGHLRSKDYWGEVDAVQRWVRNNIRYVRDIRDVETLHTPDVILSNRAGDCDDQSVLVAALLESIGHPTGFMAFGFMPDDYVHVYAITRINRSWFSVETTENVPVGWRPENIFPDPLVIFN